MRLFIICTYCFLLLVACNSNKTKEPVSLTTIDSTVEDIDLLPPEERLPWRLGYDSLTGNFRMIQQTAIDVSASPERIIEDINILWPNIRMVYQRTSGDTIFISIPDSEYLTQRMGSSGPPGYMALVTYSLTDLPGIRFVNFDFEEGDHASPGTFTKQDYKNIQ